MGLVLFEYFLSVITQTNIQASDIEDPGLHIIQYYSKWSYNYNKI